MSMQKFIPENENTVFFIFKDNLILSIRSDSKNASEQKKESPEFSSIPKNVFQRCLELQCAKDWFFDTRYNYAAMLFEADCPLPPNTAWIPMRQLFALETEYTFLASHALAVLNWNQTMRFCPHCGSVLENHKEETAKHCFNCNENHYPTISPCMIVRITKGNEMLLARHKQRNTDLYTCLAGYLEPGETLEQCVAREVFEETGIRVKNIKYVASQSWPFPDQMMVGFSAEYESGSINLQEDEITEVVWVSKDKLPAIPKKGSLAHKLITEW